MPLLKKGHEAQFLFEVAGKKLGVVDFSVRERVSSLFSIELTLAKDQPVSFDEVIGMDGLLTILSDEADRHFHGIISEFVQTGVIEKHDGPLYYLYRAAMTPLMWLLSLEQDCRIFQQKNTPDIIKIILEDTGITGDKYEFRLQSSYEPRDYCVQYRETDLNFISRLLEEEGIFYFFEHSEGNHKVIFADGTAAYQPIQGNPSLLFRPAGDLAPTEEFVYNFFLSRQIRTGKVTLKDFNFKKPSLNLLSEEQGAKFQELEVYDYPGEYLDKGLGKKLAKIRLQEAVMFTDKAEGKSYCPRFTPGYTFTLEDHELEDFNQEYLLVEVFHSGSQPQTLEAHGDGAFSYHNQFFGVPSSVTLRPERNTPKPIMEGVQTAIIVGPKGEEIYTDEHGRVKVQFHWDREGKMNEKSSCWIRVSQVWAGAGWGAMWLPRLGHEVIVDFIEGDPDRPIITGRVYHGANTPPYSLPGDKNKSTIKSDSTVGGGGSNEIRFDDSKGSEEIYTHAQKDQNEVVENNMSTSVGVNQSVSVGSNQTISVGNNRSKTVGVDQSETVGNNKTIQVGTNHKESIGASMNTDVGDNRKLNVGNNMHIKVGKNKDETVTMMSSEMVGLSKSVMVGASHSITVGASTSLTVALQNSVTVGANMKESVIGWRSESVGQDKSVEIGKNLTVKVDKNLSEEVTETHSLKTKKAIIEAQDEICFKVGSASIVMKSNGDIIIKGNNIKTKGSGKVSAKGSKITEN